MSANTKHVASIEERLAALEERHARDTELILKGMASMKEDNEANWKDNAHRWQAMREEVSRKLSNYFEMIMANIWDAEKVRRDKWAYQLDQDEPEQGE